MSNLNLSKILANKTQPNLIADLKSNPSELFKYLSKKATENAEIVDWEVRGQIQKIRVKMLTYVEEEYCYSQALQSCKDSKFRVEELGAEQWDLKVKDAIICEIVALSITDVEPTASGNYNLTFPDAKALKSILYGNELAELVSIHNHIKSKFAKEINEREIYENIDKYVSLIANGAKVGSNFLSHMPSSIVAVITEALAMVLVILRTSQPALYQDCLENLLSIQPIVLNDSSYIEDASNSISNSLSDNTTSTD